MREEFPAIEATGASLVAIAPDSLDGVKRFTTKEKYPFALLADTDGSIFDAYDVTSRLISLGQQPAMFIVAEDGKVRFDAIGAQQWDLISPAELIKQLAAS